jgi:DNA-binding transcriptional LysR family regulator
MCLSFAAMDLRQLSALLAVAEHGTFSAAAKALYTVQSNVSTHIARLERELGVTLVDRSRGLVTEEGAIVVARARRILNEIDAMRADVLSMGEEVAGDVRLGVISSTARWLVPPLLSAIRERHRRIRPIVVEASTTSLAPQLLNGQLDMAVLNLPTDEPELSTEVLFEEDLVLVVPEQHVLAEHERITLTMLADHPLLLAPPGTALRDDVEAASSAAGVKLQALAEIDGVRLMASLAFAAAGPALLPATGVPIDRPGPWRRVVVDGIPRRQVGLARRRRGLPSSPARAVASVLVEIVPQQGTQQPGVHLLG